MSNNKISICTGVKNRTDRVLPCIKSWLDWELCDEFILIDWSSDESVQDFLDTKGYKHPKLKVKRIANKPYYEPSAVNNEAINRCKNDKILRVDIDYVLKKPDLFKKIILSIDTDTEFLDGNFCGHLHGLCYFKKDHFIECGMYDTAFDEGWSMEDTDFFQSLTHLGLKSKNIICKIYELLKEEIDLPVQKEGVGVAPHGLTIKEREDLFGKIVEHIPHKPKMSAINFKIPHKCVGSEHNFKILKNKNKRRRQNK